jgi:hypothetical protein
MPPVYVHDHPCVLKKAWPLSPQIGIELRDSEWRNIFSFGFALRERNFDRLVQSARAPAGMIVRSRAYRFVCGLRSRLPGSSSHLQGWSKRPRSEYRGHYRCSAAIGVLAGLGAPQLSLILAFVVLLANIALRPLAYRLHPILLDAAPRETSYEINLTCRQKARATPPFLAVSQD